MYERPWFPFWNEYRDHSGFLVSIHGSGDRSPYTFRVSTFQGLTSSVRAFVESVTLPGQTTVCMADIFRRGETSVHGFTVRVIPFP